MAPCNMFSILVCFYPMMIVLGYNAARFPKQHHKMESGYRYHTLYFPQTLDHFNFLANDKQFAQRYLINNDYFKPGGPVFFYTGNEGDITWFCNNTGFMWDIAPEYNALLVFAEHRYYGESLPFGKSSFKDADHLGYLSSEQALADFAVLIDHIRVTIPEAKNSPFIAFGGSYGGMLAAWFRMKYPASVAGAISASAPIFAFNGMLNQELFFRTTSQDFLESGGKDCPASIRKSWDIIASLGRTALGRKKLSEAFKLCKPLTNVDDLTGLLGSAYVGLGMVDYPYSASFLEPLPGNPIKYVCEPLQDSSATGMKLIGNIAAAVNRYFNYTGTAKCLDIDMQADATDLAWDFQGCTELFIPLSSDGVNDMWPPNKFDIDARVKECRQNWGVTTRKTWLQSQYGLSNLDAASNIVFSNGRLDPWSGYGVLNSTNPNIVTVFIKDGAHHLDLRSSNALDPQSVIEARNVHRKNIDKWIDEWHRGRD